MELTIDGRKVSASAGQTILEVARGADIYIPSLCYHPRTGQAGRCRACLVEVAGMRGLQTACTVAAKDGMQVTTDSETVLAARRMVVELLLSDGTHNCIACEANGACELQDMAYKCGIEAPTFLVDGPAAPVDESSEGIVRDLRKCIQCGRCVTGCNENVVNEVLDFGGRGGHTQLVCDDDKPMGASTCVQCGECVQVCPVGALITKRSRGTARSWETSATKVTCPYCGVGCQIDIHVKDNKIVRTTGHEHRWQEQPNRGMLCVKGRFGLDFVTSPERLTTPLIRRNGVLEPASWDEALDFTADRLKTVKADHGADSIGFFLSAKVSNEENYAMMRFGRAVIGTHNVDHCARL